MLEGIIKCFKLVEFYQILKAYQFIEKEEFKQKVYCFQCNKLQIQDNTKMVIVVEQPAPSYNIMMAIIGGVIAAVSLTLYYVFQKKVLNYLEEVWSIVHFWKSTFVFITVTMPESLAFVGGTLVAGGVFYDFVEYDNFNGLCPYGPKSFLLRHTSIYGFALAGLLVGFGARVMHGDIHAHGYSQVGKRNVRSFLALILILAAAILGGTLATSNFIPILSDGYRNLKWNFNHEISANICIGVGVILLILGFIMRRAEFNDMSRILKQMLTAFLFSFTFAAGLLISGMSRRMNVVHGFSVFSQFTPILFITIGVTLLLTFIFFLIASSTLQDRTLFGEDFYKVSDAKITPQLILGALCYGFGWGLSGVQITTWLLQFSVFTFSIGLFFGAFMIGGMFLAHFIQSRAK